MQNSIETFIDKNFVLVAIYALYFLVSLVLEYVFFSLGTYRLMKKRNLSSPFISWIPIAQEYALGSVYDDIRKKENNGKDPYFRIAMLISILLGTCIVFIVFYLITVKKIFEKYVPNNNSYFAASLIFTILFFVAPFVPGLCLMKASNNDSIEGQQLQTGR